MLSECGSSEQQSYQFVANSGPLGAENIDVFSTVAFFLDAKTKERTRKTEGKLDRRYKESHERKKPK
jgi:hypothetical protein